MELVTLLGLSLLLQRGQLLLEGKAAVGFCLSLFSPRAGVGKVFPNAVGDTLFCGRVSLVHEAFYEALEWWGKLRGRRRCRCGCGLNPTPQSQLMGR